MRTTFARAREASRAIFTLSLLSVLCAASAAQQGGDAERRRAFELFDSNQFADALPLLERLAQKYPSDGQVLARLGLTVVGVAVVITDPQKRQQERARGRALLVRAKELGVTTDLIENTLIQFAADGSMVEAEGDASRERFSQNREADAAMREGEAAFARNDYDAALKAYERALHLDPKIYYAPLFEGDAYMQMQQWDKAGEAYARAVRIDPDAEMAYRYWGDMLLRRGRLDEARDKFVEAIIAKPYDDYVWNNGLVRWADTQGVRLGHPKIEPQSSVSLSKDNGPSVALDPSSLNKTDGTSAWTLYAITRAGWSIDNGARFLKTYPSEKTYRHSLAEETEALLMVVQSVRQQQKDGKIKQLDPALARLVKLSDENLIAAYVLLARPDEGIAQDYVAYRKAYRERLRRYIVEYVIGG